MASGVPESAEGSGRLSVLPCPVLPCPVLRHW